MRIIVNLCSELSLQDFYWNHKELKHKKIRNNDKIKLYYKLCEENILFCSINAHKSMI